MNPTKIRSWKEAMKDNEKTEKEYRHIMMQPEDYKNASKRSSTDILLKERYSASA